MTRLFSGLALVMSLTACGDDAVSYSDPVGLSMSVASGDVGGDGALVADKNINTESGNTYAAYIAAAEAEIGTPDRITVDSVTLEIVGGSADALESIYGDQVDVTFVMNSTDAAFTVAAFTVADGDGVGPIEADVDFDSDDVDDENYASLVDGNFKVELAGAAADGFEAAGADADFELVLLFTAYE